MRCALPTFLAVSIVAGCAAGDASDEFRTYRRDAEPAPDMRSLPDAAQPDASQPDARAGLDDAQVDDASPVDAMIDPCVRGPDLDGDNTSDVCDACPDFADDGQSACPADLGPCVDFAENTYTWGSFAEDGAMTRIDFGPGITGLAVRARTEAGFAFHLHVRAPDDAVFALHPADVIRASLRGVNTNMPTWQGEFPEVRLVDGAERQRVLKPAVPRLSADGTWETFAIPISGSPDWPMQDRGADLGDIRRIEIAADTWETGFEMSVDGLTVARAGQICFGLRDGIFE